MNLLSFQKMPPHVRQICAMLAALIPVILVEALNQGRLDLWVAPFLMLGAYMGLRYQWPLWSSWWLSWTIVAIGNAWMFAMPAHDPVLFMLWKPALLLCIGFIAFFLWQRSDGFLAAFALLPCLLEFPRLLLFNDFPAGNTGPLFLARGISILVYAFTAISILGPTLHRRWWVLFTAIFVQLTAVVFLSYPILAGFILYPAFLATFILLAFGAALVGLILDGLRLSTAPWKRLGWMAALLVIFLGGFLPLLSGDAFYPPPQPLVAGPGAKLQSIIIDTDMSHDDMVAILFLLQRPDLDIRAITVVNGVAHVKPGVENVRRILALAGRTDIPVAGGPDDPLDGKRAFPDDWRILVDFSVLPALPSVPAVADERSAPQLIVQQAGNSPRPVRLFALGPLTNVALAIRQDPGLPDRLEDIFISGGAINVPGAIHEEFPANANAAADWNLYIDPVAADEVFRSGVRLALAPLDVTHRTGAHPLLLSPAFIDKFFASASGREARLLARIIRGSQLMTSPSAPEVQMWDLPAVVLALEPQVCSNWQDLALRIILAPDDMAGKTITEKGQAPNARACLDGDLTAFENILLTSAPTGLSSH